MAIRELVQFIYDNTADNTAIRDGKKARTRSKKKRITQAAPRSNFPAI
jgi:hypothetical protein